MPIYGSYSSLGPEKIPWSNEQSLAHVAGFHRSFARCTRAFAPSKNGINEPGDKRPTYGYNFYEDHLLSEIAPTANPNASVAQGTPKKMTASFWKSLQVAPRGHNKVLQAVAWLRFFAIAAAVVRLIYDSLFTEGSQSFQLAVELFAAIALIYSLTMLVVLRLRRSWFFTTESKVIQVAVDLLIFWFAQYFTQNSKSDIYYLNLIPLVIAVEYFPFLWACGVLAFIIAGQVLMLELISPGHPYEIWIRDFLPRSYIFLVVSAVFLAQRQMRTQPERTLDNDREEIIARVRQSLEKAPGVKKDLLGWLEHRLDTYIDKTEFYRRIFSRRYGDRKTGLDYSVMARALDGPATSAPLQQPDSFVHIAHQALEEIAKSLGCVAGVYRVESTSAGKPSLELAFAWGCGCKANKREP